MLDAEFKYESSGGYVRLCIRDGRAHLEAREAITTRQPLAASMGPDELDMMATIFRKVAEHLRHQKQT